MSVADRFFEEQKGHSEVKSRIVAKFFTSWTSVIVGAAKRTGRKPRLAYVDLFAGPGRYEDGSKSTPLLIMEHVVKVPELCEGLEATFNDNNIKAVASLKEALDAIPGIEKLKHGPRFLCGEVDVDVENTYANTRLVPTLSFIDPFGYKGMTTRLLRAVGKDWESDCIFFFNYRRINAAISNDTFRQHMDRLFGENRIVEMRQKMLGMPAYKRIEYTLDKLADVLREQGFRHFLSFRFKDIRGRRTTHALVYLTKDPKGFTIMKDIMSKESSSSIYGVPSYDFSPVDVVHPRLVLHNPIEELADQLTLKYSGQTVTVQKIIEAEEPNSLFLQKNYKDAINLLEAEGRLRADPPATKRSKGGKLTCGPNVSLYFQKTAA